MFGARAAYYQKFLEKRLGATHKRTIYGITDLSNFNIILSPSDTVYICTYGTTSAGCDISASLSFNVNM